MNCIKLTFWIQFHRPSPRFHDFRFEFFRNFSTSCFFQETSLVAVFPRNILLPSHRSIFRNRYDRQIESNARFANYFASTNLHPSFFRSGNPFQSSRRISLPRANRQSILRILFHRGNRKPAFTIILTIPLLHLFKSLLPPNFFKQSFLSQFPQKKKRSFLRRSRIFFTRINKRYPLCTRCKFKRLNRNSRVRNEFLLLLLFVFSFISFP